LEYRYDNNQGYTTRHSIQTSSTLQQLKAIGVGLSKGNNNNNNK